MSALIAAGVAGDGRLWSVDDERRLHLYDATPLDRRLRTALKVPLPGKARPLVLDGLAVLTASDVLRLNVRGVQAWLRYDLKGADNVKNTELMDKQLVGALPMPGGFVAWDSARRLWAINKSGVVSAFVELPIPGPAAILAVDPETKQALLADGSRLGWFGSRWVALGAPAESDDGTAATMRIRATRDFCVESGKDLAVGDVADLPQKRALELIERGWVEPVVAA
jgi:hypothetical protein